MGPIEKNSEKTTILTTTSTATTSTTSTNTTLQPQHKHQDQLHPPDFFLPHLEKPLLEAFVTSP